MIDSKKLLERMDAVGVTQKQAGEALHCAQSTISLKINNKRPFYLDEAYMLAELLDIKQDFFSYFFAPDVA